MPPPGHDDESESDDEVLVKRMKKIKQGTKSRPKKMQLRSKKCVKAKPEKQEDVQKSPKPPIKSEQLSKFGWGVVVAITPTVLLLQGVGFFPLILFGELLAPVLAKFGMTPLLAVVYMGALQNIFNKSAKGSLFDPCKEMACIPLDEETKVS
ncbi:hypothetical protein Cgig2_009371 [Carnegiea gigantea]|uniref:ADP,ATP carrier protein n=1 Tax=Carnegiea gigantea TaxID=171969 RepID=A0A9Q1Q7I0_9CARY|nr:hypothetical protein Cgig2_009371 [Carnegiea gigantea]